MTLRIAQDAKYESKDWWSWSVWLEGEETELDSVVSVQWVLHATFPDPVREVTNRRSRFKLHSRGWGEFTIKARVKRKEGKPLLLRHPLKLEYPASDRSTRAARSKGPRVYLSYESSASKAADVLKNVLDKRGIKWSDASVAAEGSVPLRAALVNHLSTADAVVQLHSESSNAWVQWETSTARARGVPVVSIDVPSSQGGARASEAEVGEAVDKLLASHLGPMAGNG